MEKLIITLAHTGNVPTKALNPHTPVTIDEIVEDIKTCRELGAAVAHIHVRDEEEKPTSRRDLFEKVLKGLDEEKVDIIRQVSTGARGGENTIEWRGQMLDLPGAEMASLSTGSSNFPTSVNANSPELIESLAKKMYDHGIKPEIEAFDVGMIDNARRLLKKGILKGPIHFNFVMNVPGAIAGTPKNLMHMVECLPQGSTFNVSGIGRSQVNMITMAILLGGHVRTGLEDVIKYDKDTLATNAMLIERVVRIAKELGREIATPDEARKILGI
ncbi:3-keto-5-aminohexanoate cleavage protein [Crassaminicella profunda]|uniref:3-keto-5-aminohexanoate cleavage protein n=1 Tax=Crassaminicella profunda TaxID=1286698 RepID=UPI001CA6A71D|nr:3-keto-5-aminohexanoate cleavage protein [Crassaminicella profunda]QZY55516.1 3-keto-5-aminohexanoate cleavage protein [Crassaminicella profunda]